MKKTKEKLCCVVDFKKKKEKNSRNESLGL